MGKLIDLTGQRFSRLVALRREKTPRGYVWLCQCDCGNLVPVLGYNLRSGHTQSCGCLQRDRATESATIHNGTGSRLYRTWAHMKGRCLNTKDAGYKNYGGRGIRLCRSWMRFEAFREWAINSGYTEALTIERVNVDGDYCPENCVWIPSDEQAKNKRSNHRFTINGKTDIMTNWARQYGIKPETVFDRLHKGWDELSALTRPVKGGKQTWRSTK